MADTLRIISQVRPEVLRSEKKIDWSTALAFEKKDDLINYLREKYVFDFGWLPLPQRVEFFRKPIGLHIQCPKEDLELLEAAELLRHLIIHNGGKVSQDYLTRTKRKDVAIGEFIPITLEYIDKVSITSSFLTEDLFIAVSKQIFGIEDDDLRFLSWYREKESGNNETL